MSETYQVGDEVIVRFTNGIEGDAKFIVQDASPLGCLLRYADGEAPDPVSRWSPDDLLPYYGSLTWFKREGKSLCGAQQAELAALRERVKRYEIALYDIANDRDTLVDESHIRRLWRIAEAALQGDDIIDDRLDAIEAMIQARKDAVARLAAIAPIDDQDDIFVIDHAMKTYGAIDDATVALAEVVPELLERLRAADAALQAAIQGNSPGLIRMMALHSDRLRVNASALLPAVDWLNPPTTYTAAREDADHA